jgi:hypothetical protein
VDDSELATVGASSAPSLAVLLLSSIMSVAFVYEATF